VCRPAPELTSERIDHEPLAGEAFRRPLVERSAT
jgi:hypothetical protein